MNPENPVQTINETFLQDVVRGLRSTPKQLPSKYFYDAEGDRLFGEIMRCPEYYLTRCEEEIIRASAAHMAALFAAPDGIFDLVELGSGDATKSVYLLREIFSGDTQCCYYPIDISSSALAQLEDHLPEAIPGLVMQGLNGEYLPMIEACYQLSSSRKVLMFMGATIGNMRPAEALAFLTELRARMQPADQLLIGFDLVKSPQQILDAYNDAGGFTRDFNLNLLRRINRELGGDFAPEQFYHYPTYDPDTGAAKSYLVSKQLQTVFLTAANTSFAFQKGEPIYTEVSQKYTPSQIEVLAQAAGFSIHQNFSDTQEQFLVSLWQVENLQ